jgi:hypothetical protein
MTCWLPPGASSIRRCRAPRSEPAPATRRTGQFACAKAAEEKDAAAKKKGFKEYAPGFIHIDIKRLPKMPDETSRRYLFVAIDRARRWGFLHIDDDQSEESSLDSLKRLQTACVRFTFARYGQRRAIHRALHFPAKTAFRQSRLRPCLYPSRARIDHRLIPPRHPQTNGMVEHFNGRINELLPRPALQAPPNSNKHWTTFLWRTTTASRNRPLDIALSLTHSHHGMPNTLNCSLRQSLYKNHNQAERDSPMLSIESKRRNPPIFI